jgi:spoIIIJ-associated protein
LLDAAEDATEMLMNFAGIEAGASADSGGERVEVEIEGPDASLLVVEDGKGLLAIQHLLPRMLRGMTGRSSFVRVDSQEFHQKRRERLEALAAKEAEAASRSGRPRTLPPMAPDERRIVHLALKDSPAVVTESRGSGLHKRVVVRPVAGDGGSDDIEARHGF